MSGIPIESTNSTPRALKECVTFLSGSKSMVSGQLVKDPAKRFVKDAGN
jgi:hypothetical protein